VREIRGVCWGGGAGGGELQLLGSLLSSVQLNFTQNTQKNNFTGVLVCEVCRFSYTKFSFKARLLCVCLWGGGGGRVLSVVSMPFICFGHMYCVPCTLK
jgi:hypothetical protein